MRPLFAAGLSLAMFVGIPSAFSAAETPRVNNLETANSVETSNSVEIANSVETSQLVQKGIAAHSSGSYAEAEAIWRQILSVSPDNDAAYNNLGNALAELGRLTEAESAYRAAIRLAPEEAAIRYYNLGNVLAAQEKNGCGDRSFSKCHSP